MEQAKHTIEDETESHAGRIPKATYFKTTWTKDIKLLQYFRSWRDRRSINEPHPLDNLSRQDKLAIARHKKELMVNLGLIKEPKQVKIIYMSSCPTDFFTEWAIEKEKVFENSTSRYDKDYCVLWSEKKEQLIKEYDKLREDMDKQLKKIRNKIMEVNENE